MILHDDDIMAFAESEGHIFAQRLAAGHGIRGKAYGTANALRGKNSKWIRDFPGDAERYQCRRMRVYDGFNVGSTIVNGFVERIF